MEDGPYRAHFVLVPLLAQGHIIPMIDMARLLASRSGVLATFVTTPVNAARARPVIEQIRASNLPVRFLELPFPCSEVGLPDGCENIDLIHFPNTEGREKTDLLLASLDLLKTFFLATHLLRAPLESHLREQQPPPTCIVADVCLPWTADIAKSLDIPRVVFHGQSCLSLACYHSIELHDLDRSVTDATERFLVPDLPHGIQVTRTEAPGFFSMPGWETLRRETMEAESSADGVVLNSFDDLEGLCIEYYQKEIEKHVWVIGPLSLGDKDPESKAKRGSEASINESQCLSWLDSKETASVIYVSFGSLVYTNPLQLMEIGYGLEACGCPFVWVIREAHKSPELEHWVGELQQRTSGRGLISFGWAPQMVILSHPAVGGFVTHCGWNSVLEAVSLGLPMVTWPRSSDQFLNEKLIVEVLDIGVSVGSQPPNHLSMKKMDTVERSVLEKAVKSLMEKGSEGDERRQRAREYGEKARKAMEEGGSSYVGMTELIEFTLQHAKKNLDRG